MKNLYFMLLLVCFSCHNNRTEEEPDGTVKCNPEDLVVPPVPFFETDLLSCSKIEDYLRFDMKMMYTGVIRQFKKNIIDNCYSPEKIIDFYDSYHTTYLSAAYNESIPRENTMVEIESILSSDSILTRFDSQDRKRLLKVAIEQQKRKIYTKDPYTTPTHALTSGCFLILKALQYENVPEINQKICTFYDEYVAVGYWDPFTAEDSNLFLMGCVSDYLSNFKID